MFLHTYGWTDAFQQLFDALPDPGLIPARVIMQQRGSYQVMSGAGELTAQIAGKFALEALPGDYPVVGDWVAISVRAEESAATIHHVLPRASSFKRKAARRTAAAGAEQVVAANLDIALLVQSLNGDLNPRRMERYLFVARDGGAEPVIVLTKADACDDVEAARASIEGIAAGARVYVVSALTGAGMEIFETLLGPGKTAALLGSSGVGKSTLVNALAGADVMLTRAISGDDKRGRHTTTHRELILLPSGALLLDSPGMRSLGVWDSDGEVETAFPDVEEIMTQCRFSDCGHNNEPGCAVREALESGGLTQARWGSYQKLKRELAFAERKEDPRARAEQRQKWIKLHKAGRAKSKRKAFEDD